MSRFNNTFVKTAPKLFLKIFICFLSLSIYHNLLAQNQPTSRYGHTIAVDNSGNIYMFGGFSNSGESLSKTSSAQAIHGDLWQWDNSQKEWAERNPLTPPPARYSHSAAFSSADGTEKLYIFFGDDGTGGFNMGCRRRDT